MPDPKPIRPPRPREMIRRGWGAGYVEHQTTRLTTAQAKVLREEAEARGISPGQRLRERAFPQRGEAPPDESWPEHRTQPRLPEGMEILAKTWIPEGGAVLVSGDARTPFTIDGGIMGRSEITKRLEGLTDTLRACGFTAVTVIDTPNVFGVAGKKNGEDYELTMARGEHDAAALDTLCAAVSAAGAGGT